MDFTILLAVLRSLATVAGDPALGLRGNSIASALQLIALAIEAGSNGKEELEKLQLQVAEMVSNRREPTKDEWAELKARSDAAHDALKPQ